MSSTGRCPMPQHFKCTMNVDGGTAGGGKQLTEQTAGEEDNAPQRPPAADDKAAATSPAKNTKKGRAWSGGAEVQE